jgi:uncharacterized protein YcbK (DUF882 family)
MSTSARFVRFSTMLLAFVFVSLAQIATAHAGRDCLPDSLKQKLNQIEMLYGKVQVLSTFRKGARIAGSSQMSYHSSCRAVDFKPPPGKYQEVLSWLKANHKGGLGTYSCGMSHLHIDNGPHIRFHKCQSASR